MVTLAFSQLADLVRKRQRFGKVLEAEDAVEARDALLSQDLVWPKYSNPLPTDHQNDRPNYLNIDLASL